MLSLSSLSGYQQPQEHRPGRLSLLGIALEKGHYPFKNYRHAKAQSVLFPGCNFPSLYPKTCAALVDLLAEHNVGVAYDCCGKPLHMMQREDDFQRICKHIDKRLARLSCTEIVCVCPNCLYALRSNVSQSVVSVYAKLKELGIEPCADSTDGSGDAVYFPPCPDRRVGAIARDIEAFLPAGTRTLPCAGQLASCRNGDECGGCKALPCCRQDCSHVLDRKDSILTACASCSGYLAAKGYDKVDLALTRALGIDEKHGESGIPFINRARTKLL